MVFVIVIEISFILKNLLTYNNEVRRWRNTSECASFNSENIGMFCWNFFSIQSQISSREGGEHHGSGKKRYPHSGQSNLWIITLGCLQNSTLRRTEKGEPTVDQKITDLYDKYTHDLLDRREFLRRLSILTGSTAAAIALLPLLENNIVRAQIAPKNDSRLDTNKITYPGATGEVRAYLARPKGNEKLPGVVVIHENRGLVPHIEDVTRRVALEGFVAIAPDALTPVGGTPEDQEKAPALFQKLDAKSTTEDFVAAARYLKTHPASTGKVGVIGFCWGGAMANQVAVNSPDVLAAVPYYGRQPVSEDVPKVKASLLLHYAGLDEGINKGIQAFEADLKKAFVDYKIYMYEGAQHAFNNDTNSARYNKEAAQLAWQRTISFLKEKLKK
jgi:carboxymethylenebutenolidase